MDVVTGFDAKEYHGGHLKDFFAPIGLSASVTNYESFKIQYKRVWRDAFIDNGLEQKRLVNGARDLEQLYPEKKVLLQEIFIEGIKRDLVEINFFFTIMSQTKNIYSRGWDKVLPANEFMKKSLLLPYPYICAWKQLQKWCEEGSSFRPFIDEFDGEETVAWYNLTKAKPLIFYRGDMSNPLIATCDVILDYLDYKLRKQKLHDKTIDHELKSLNLIGQRQYIGQPDLHNITSTSPKSIDKTLFRAKPIYYLIFEDKPAELTDKKQWLESKIYCGMVDFAIKNAFENDGCIKFYDSRSDFKFLSSRDCFIWCGTKGKEIVNGIGKANGTKEIFYSGQEKVL